MNTLCGGRIRKQEPRRQVPAVRRVGMGLKKRIEGPAVKPGSKSGKRVHIYKPVKEIPGRRPSGRQHTKPCSCMPAKHRDPAVKGGVRDCEHFIDALNRHGMGIIQFQYMQDKRQRVLPVRDNPVRLDGVCMAAAAANPYDLNPVFDRLAVHKIHDATFVAGKDFALAFGAAGRAPFTGRIKCPQESGIKIRRRAFLKKELAINQVFPYHSLAFSTMLSLKTRAMPLHKAWRCMEEEPDLWRDGFFLLFYCRE